VGVPQINEKFQLHWIETKFGYTRSSHEDDSVLQVQLDRDAALGAQGVSKKALAIASVTV
jgi:hypothetical protein